MDRLYHGVRESLRHLARYVGDDLLVIDNGLAEQAI